MGAFPVQGSKGEAMNLKLQMGSYARGTWMEVYVDNIAWGVVNSGPNLCPSVQLVSEAIPRKVGAGNATGVILVLCV